MIDPSGIRKQAERWWPDVLRAALTGAVVFPQNINRIGKVKSGERLRDFTRIRAEQDALIAHSKERIGQSYTLHWVERDYRSVGRNRFIETISFETLADYLAFLRRQTAYDRFRADTDLILTAMPDLHNWVLDHPLSVEQYHGVWPDLLRLVRYFRTEHVPGRYYIRELPVAVPTKFVESHTTILRSLLDAVLPPELVDAGRKKFERRYGLRYRLPQVRLRLLDQSFADTHLSGLTDIALPLDAFESLTLPLRRVIVLENKTNFSNILNFLTLPQWVGTAGIFGSGFGVGRLKRAAWLHRVELYYWGDLDAHGLQILSQLRGYFPHLRPLLMDRATFDAFSQYHTDAPTSTALALPHLTDDEQALFDYLNDNRLRLEQERIPVARVRAAFAEMNE